MMLRNITIYISLVLNLFLTGCITNFLKPEPEFDIGIKYYNDNECYVTAENDIWQHDQKNNTCKGKMKEFNYTYINGKSNVIKGFNLLTDSRYLLDPEQLNTGLPLILEVHLDERIKKCHSNKIYFKQKNKVKSDFESITSNDFYFNNNCLTINNLTKTYEKLEKGGHTPKIILFCSINKQNMNKQFFENKTLKNNSQTQQIPFGLLFKDIGRYTVRASIKDHEWKSVGNSSSDYFGKLFTFSVEMLGIDFNRHKFQNFGIVKKNKRIYVKIDKSDESKNRPIDLYIHGITKPGDLNFALEDIRVKERPFLVFRNEHFKIGQLSPSEINYFDYGSHQEIHFYFTSNEAALQQSYFPTKKHLRIEFLNMDEKTKQLISNISFIQLSRNNKPLNIPISQRVIDIQIHEDEEPGLVKLKSYFGELLFHKNDQFLPKIVYQLNVEQYLKDILIYDQKGNKIPDAYVSITLKETKMDDGIGLSLSCLYKAPLGALKKISSIHKSFSKKEDQTEIQTNNESKPLIYLGKSDSNGSLSFFTWNKPDKLFQIKVLDESLKHSMATNNIEDGKVIVQSLPRLNVRITAKTKQGSSIPNVMFTIMFKNSHNDSEYTFIRNVKSNINGVAICDIPIIQSSYYCDIVARKSNYFENYMNNIKLEDLNKSLDIQLNLKEIYSLKNIELTSINQKELITKQPIKANSLHEKNKQYSVLQENDNNRYDQNLLKYQDILIILEKTDKNFLNFTIVQNALMQYLEEIKWDVRLPKADRSIKLVTAYEEFISPVTSLNQLKNEFPFCEQESSMDKQLKKSIYLLRNSKKHIKKIIYIVSSKRSIIAPYNFYEKIGIDKFNKKNTSISFVVVGKNFSNILNLIASSTNGEVYNCNTQEEVLKSIKKLIYLLNI